jgi:hypothetical protein
MSKIKCPCDAYQDLKQKSEEYAATLRKRIRDCAETCNVLRVKNEVLEQVNAVVLRRDRALALAIGIIVVGILVWQMVTLLTR